MEEKKVVFLGFIFELFCRFFSNKDVSGFFGFFDIVIEVVELGFNELVVLG